MEMANCRTMYHKQAVMKRNKSTEVLSMAFLVPGYFYFPSKEILTFSHPSGLYDASTMDGDEYAFEVTHVQWTANIMSIMRTATITIDLMSRLPDGKI